MGGIIYREEILKDYPDVLTVCNVQHILHLGRNTVYRLLADGKIKAFKAGRRYIIPKISLIEYILQSE